MAHFRQPTLTIVKAVVISIGTLVFYFILCILLSYSILDLISPHPQVNGLAGRPAEENSASSDPISSGFVSHFQGPIPDSQRPWDPSSTSGSKILTLLSEQRFPFNSTSISGWAGMKPPPSPQWPPARLIHAKPARLQAPVSLNELSGLVHLQSSPEKWNPNSNGFQMYTLPSIQWPNFAKDSSWDTDELRTKNVQRREWVVRAFTHAWEAYKAKSWGYDQVNPFSGTGENAFSGWGLNIIDNLYAYFHLICDLHSPRSREYNYARTHVRALDWSNPINLPYDNTSRRKIIGLQPHINVLESGTRYLGALLSAYDLSGDSLMLLKADELAQWLLPAFNTKTGIPTSNYELGTNPKEGFSGDTYLSEAGGLLLEFTKLAQATGNAHYFNPVDRAARYLQSNAWNSTARLGQLFPQKINPDQPNKLFGYYNFKKNSNVYYQNLIKELLLLRGNSDQYHESYISAAESILKYLAENIKLDNNGTELSIVGEAYSLPGKVTFIPKINQQSCSAASMFGLGAKLLQQQNQLDFALNHTDACLWVHEKSPDGLGPDELTVINYEKADSRDTSTPMNEISDARHLIQSETIEAIFYMWRLTGNREWQDRGWKLFTKWAEASITPYGFADIADVTQDVTDDNNKYDSQNTSVSSGSLKYFFLLFSEPDMISLDEYVFSSASHPFKIPGSSSKQPVQWKAPADDKFAFLNPPAENMIAAQPSNKIRSASGSYGTYLQQWYRTMDENAKSNNN